MRHTIQPMHIGIDCRLPTYRLGGISQYVIHLIQALAAVAAEERFTIFHSRKEERDFRPPGDGRFARGRLWTPCHHRLERQALAVELWPQGLDIYHSPDFIPPAGGAERRIITVHDLTFLHYPDFLTAESRRYYADQIAWAVSVADHIIADSEATRADIISLLDVAPSKITAIYLAANPIYSTTPTPNDLTATAAEYNLAAGFLLSVGTLEPRKNLPLLLRAYATLRARHGVSAPLVLVGSKGWIYDEIFATIDQLGLRDHVRHLTDVPDDKLAHLYHLAGVLAFPSHYEGFGLPALEAMHCGCPVVASDRGSLPELIGDAGLSISPEGEPGWVEALATVLADSDLAEALRQKGYAQARRFTWQATAHQTLAVYRNSR